MIIKYFKNQVYIETMRKNLHNRQIEIILDIETKYKSEKEVDCNNS